MANAIKLWIGFFVALWRKDSLRGFFGFSLGGFWGQKEAFTIYN